MLLKRWEPFTHSPPVLSLPQASIVSGHHLREAEGEATGEGAGCAADVSFECTFYLLQSTTDLLHLACSITQLSVD